MSASSRRRMSGTVLLLVFAAGTLLLAAGRQASTAPAISHADAIADLDALFDALDRIHPAPYFNRSRELVMADRRQLSDTLPESMTHKQWWLRLAPLVASLSDGHTELSPPPAFIETVAEMYRESTAPKSQREVFERIHLFPAGSVHLDENRRMIVTSATLAAGINRGDWIVAINEQDADRLVADWIRETSGDSQAHRASASMSSLTDLLAMHSISSPYRLTAAGPDGRVHTASIEGSTLQAHADGRGRRGPNFSYRVLQPGVGYMDFYSMAGDFGPFKNALSAMFRKVTADKVQTLVIDVRGNGGGYVEFGEELLRYVTRTPYRSWSRQEIKRSPELRAQAEVPAPFRLFPLKYVATDIRRTYTGPAGTLAVWTQPSLKTPRRADPFFTGTVCLLTGPSTFSAAVIFADTVKTFHLATVVGEETGGHANMSMEPVLYVLPRSKFPVSIASGRTVRANGEADDHNGVIPDIVVKTTAAHIRDGRDPVLDRALTCPRLQ